MRLSVAISRLLLHPPHPGDHRGQSRPKTFPIRSSPPAPGAIEADAPKAFTKTNSGLQYRVLRKGTGAGPEGIEHREGALPRLAR